MKESMAIGRVVVDVFADGICCVSYTEYAGQSMHGHWTGRSNPEEATAKVAEWLKDLTRRGRIK